MSFKMPKAVFTVARMWADTVQTKFMDSLIELLQYSQTVLCKSGEYIWYDKAPVSWHELGRNGLVERMRGDWLLMLDTDHTFAPDLLERLLLLAEKYNAKVISAIYQSKHPPHQPVAGIWVGDKAMSPILDWPRDQDAFEVGCVGAGALLIHRSVLKEVIKNFPGGPFTIEPGLSEDYSFCWRLKKLGIPIYLAPNVEAHHLLVVPLSVRDYKVPANTTIHVSSERGIMKGEESNS